MLNIIHKKTSVQSQFYNTIVSIQSVMVMFQKYPSDAVADCCDGSFAFSSGLGRTLPPGSVP